MIERGSGNVFLGLGFGNDFPAFPPFRAVRLESTS
jgi:hypothetical protein